MKSTLKTISTLKAILLILVLILSNNLTLGQELYENFNYFQKIDYNDKIVESNVDKSGTSFEKIVIDGFDSKIPFYVIKPKNGMKGKFVILLHGISGTKDNWVYPTNVLAEKYVKLKDSVLALGYSVIIPDAKYHGERSYEANFASPMTFFSTQDSQKVYNLFTTTVKDIRILMDYIQSNSGEATSSFDLVGYSMGGMITVFLNSIDDRIHRAIACVAPLDSQKAAKRVGMKEDIAKKLDMVSSKNYAEFQRAPITLLMGTKDGWYTKDEAQDFFNKINIKDKRLIFYESGHLLPDQFISDVIKNLTRE